MRCCAGVLVFYVTLTLAAWIKFITLAPAAILMTAVFALGAVYFVVCAVHSHPAKLFLKAWRVHNNIRDPSRAHCQGLPWADNCLLVVSAPKAAAQPCMLCALARDERLCHAGRWHMRGGWATSPALRCCCTGPTARCAWCGTVVSWHKRIMLPVHFSGRLSSCRVTIYTACYWICQEADSPMGLPFDWHLRPRRLGTSASSAGLQGMELKDDNGRAASDL